MPHRYAGPLRWLHWITAALIAAMFVLGLWIVWFPPKNDAFLHRLYNLHESTRGDAVAARVRADRRPARNRHPTPAAGHARCGACRGAAQSLGLYLLLLVQPVIGFLDANAAGAPLVWYEAVAVPAPIGKQPDPIAHTLVTLHAAGAALLAALLVLHLAGAAYHARRGRRCDTAYDIAHADHTAGDYRGRDARSISRATSPGFFGVGHDFRLLALPLRLGAVALLPAAISPD